MREACHLPGSHSVDNAIQLKDQFSEYTESEFLDLLAEIVEANGSEEYQDQLLEHFIQITEHPLGPDLIYYPENPADATPERVLEIVKEWRARNGLSGLLSECLGSPYEAG